MNIDTPTIHQYNDLVYHRMRSPPERFHEKLKANLLTNKFKWTNVGRHHVRETTSKEWHLSIINKNVKENKT